MPGYAAAGYSLETAKIIGMTEIQNVYDSKVSDIFVSNALGTNHTYYCDNDSMINLVNSVLAAQSTAHLGSSIMCSADSVIFTLIAHDYKQVEEVHADYIAHKAQYQTWYQTQKDLLNSCTNVADVDLLIDNILYNN